MDPVRNPFSPGAGTPPPELVGRQDLLDQVRIALARTSRGAPAKSIIAVGLRGVGKTVLLNRCQELAEAERHIPVFIEAQESRPLARLLAPELRKVLLTLDRLGALEAHVKRGLRVFRSWIGAIQVKYGDIEASLLDVEPETGVADSGSLESDLPEMFAAVGHAALSRGRPVCLILDEVQYLDAADFGALIMALHRAAQLSLPVVMVAAGLPLVVALSGQAKSYAERLFDFPAIGALGAEDAARAIRAPIDRANATISDDALATIVAATEGYPYFLQEWGYHVWNAASGPDISTGDVARAQRTALQRLDQGFFRVRFDRLTPLERDYLRAMAELGHGPHRSGDIARLLGRATTHLGQRRDALIRKGMIWSPAHGDTAFTVPLFDAFLKRVMPDWHPASSPAKA